MEIITPIEIYKIRDTRTTAFVDRTVMERTGMDGTYNSWFMDPCLKFKKKPRSGIFMRIEHFTDF